MHHRTARRMKGVHRSFIREILKVTADPEIISFAGGLPNPDLFPCDTFAEAARRTLADCGRESLQYSTTEGYPPLREFIAARYQKRFGLKADPDRIIITTGSQQCLDMTAKVFLDPGDPVVMERPGYLGAIQAFSVFEPAFRTVELTPEGPDLRELEAALDLGPSPKLFYAVTNFQNPSGLSWTGKRRQETAALLRSRQTLFIEDDPYGELRFEGEAPPPLMALCPERTLLAGSFSKVAAPGLRIGWVLLPPKGDGWSDVQADLIKAKQATDLHTSTLSQRILMAWLEDNDLDAHIERIKTAYAMHRDVMLEACAEHFPPGVRVTRPQGGMFLWAELPSGFSVMDLFDEAVRDKVAFVPGRPFYTEDGRGRGGGDRTMRLNFSNASPERIREGVARLGRAMDRFLGRAETG